MFLRPEPTPSPRWSAELPPAALALAVASAVVLRWLPTAASYDEGIYLNSLRSLISGHPLGREVFASQPPGLYDLLRLDWSFFPHSLTGLRTGFALLALLGCSATYLVARIYGGRLAGVLAVLALVCTPPFFESAVDTAPDTASASISLVGLALLVGATRLLPARQVTGLATAACGGAAIAASIAVKLDGLTAVVPAAALVLWAPHARRSSAAAFAGALAVVAAVAFAYVGVRSQLWQSAVVMHEHAREIHFWGVPEGVTPQARYVFSQFEARTHIALWLVGVGVLGLAAHLLESRRKELAWLLIWPFLTAAFLLWQRPLLSQHIVLLAAACAAPAGVGLGHLVGLLRRRRARTAVAVTLTAAVALLLAQAVRAHVPPEPRTVKREIVLVRAHSLPTDEVVASDDPIVAFLAHRNVPPALVDTSIVRLRTGSLRPRTVLEVLQRMRVRVVLAGPRFLEPPTRIAGIARLFTHEIRIDQSSVLFYR